MKIQDITRCLENFAPLSLQESYDNCGLILGNHQQEVTKALLCLDSTEAVVDEAIATGCNLIIAHHPIVFSGLKKLNGKNYIERTVIKAIKNDIAIYAIHTNLDNVSRGVNLKIGEKLGLKNLQILSPKKQLLKKLATYVPEADAETVRNALFVAGAGNINNYTKCSFNTPGTGTFEGNEQSKPTIGEPGKTATVQEQKIEVVFPIYSEGKIIQALKAAHPYEEVAYDIYMLENIWQEVGSGMVGELPEPISEENFLQQIKDNLHAKVVRHTPLLGKAVKKVAVCGGSGSFLLPNAIAAEADIFITADFKYHQFFDAEGKIVIADIGHYESEQYTPELIQQLLSEKLPSFATLFSKINTNPINYF
jgi:dinuclear metal center YbgI/SA1388 family protein